MSTTLTTVIACSSLFTSAYLIGKTLSMINNIFLEDKVPLDLLIFNGALFTSFSITFFSTQQAIIDAIKSKN